MAGGGLMQLVAYGAQDLYLTGNPQITFWKVVYRRYTNFALESIQQTFNGTVDFARRVQCVVSRTGDLIWKSYLIATLPAMSQNSGTVNWARFIGHVLIADVYVEIGGQQIDKHYGTWLQLWYELSMTAEKEAGYNVMIGNTTALTTPSASIPQSIVYIPLQFWFCRNPGLALPLIALQYHEVRINVDFNTAANCYITNNGAAPSSGTPQLVDASLWIDYVFLDTEERRQFAQVGHEYLIEQLQFTGSENYTSNSISSRLSFNHPTKELVFALQLASNVSSGANRWMDFTDNGTGPLPYAGAGPLAAGVLLLNGQQRFTTREGDYFNLVQPYQHHTRIPATGIYVYSFALNPEDHQPSGTLNMSRIDNATLQLALTTGSQSINLYTYATNYNILRILSGMGGLAYST